MIVKGDCSYTGEESWAWWRYCRLMRSWSSVRQMIWRMKYLTLAFDVVVKRLEKTLLMHKSNTPSARTQVPKRIVSITRVSTNIPYSSSCSYFAGPGAFVFDVDDSRTPDAEDEASKAGGTTFVCSDHRKLRRPREK